MPLLILFAIFGLYVYLELSLLITIGSAIGVFPLILLLVLSSVIGLWIIRLRGWYTMLRLQQQLRQREMPSQSLVQTALWLLAGVLFLIPGFLSDILAILLLLPFSARLLEKYVSRKVRSFAFFSAGFTQTNDRYRPDNDTVYEAEYDKKVDEDKRLH
ncbi:FxsA family protein [Testudinibacter sp. TR-2022]|uniref:FxsA family protein n=1 Tax=Testudinibacter sp. TR-2022 TaxID=2585029 RepID=UPI0011181668|nr:FxsA family protein [Testudinibacter sp. TR-2022]TNH01579.1 FxsA family protein [Pasteurellaceae bacterium Phil31]TNH04310.1 FxsA family protein [Testudinibacter sp. TR-2022]TNH09286.1 FxsA family protein [Testudinibacter sp. TR-2022]TNH12990.1 FxsA family protein [Testudinibacter sp. TR-2022]TNH14862.1 FxsA family protein [Testudinibacter sp. TR-2022]